MSRHPILGQIQRGEGEGQTDAVHERQPVVEPLLPLLVVRQLVQLQALPQRSPLPPPFLFILIASWKDRPSGCGQNEIFPSHHRLPFGLSISARLSLSSLSTKHFNWTPLKGGLRCISRRRWRGICFARNLHYCMWKKKKSPRLDGSAKVRCRGRRSEGQQREKELGGIDPGRTTVREAQLCLLPQLLLHSNSVENYDGLGIVFRGRRCL